MELQNTTLALITTEAPNSTHSDGGDGPHPTDGTVDWVVWVIVSGSLLCLVLSVLGYVVFMVLLPRRGYMRIESRRKQMMAFTQLLEEMRGRPRKVEPEESLTESERHFLIHDFADFP